MSAARPLDSRAEPGARDPHASAVEALWQVAAAPLRAWFARRASPQDAEDLVQDTFLRVQERLGTLRSPGATGPDAKTVRGWVAVIARHVWIDHLRRRRPEETRSEDPIDSTIDSSTDPADDLEAVVAGWLESFVQQLDPEDAEALRATDLGRLTQLELARQLGLSPSGARSRVQRARVRLRERLEACCAFAFDARGALLDARPRHPRCADGCP